MTRKRITSLAALVVILAVGAGAAGTTHADAAGRFGNTVTSSGRI